MRINQFLPESAVQELADKLPTLKRTDYDAIDELMKRISLKHNLQPKKLHDLFVHKYGHNPDHWLKKIKGGIEEGGDLGVIRQQGEYQQIEESESEDFYLTINGRPVKKTVNIFNAQKLLKILKKGQPNSNIQINCVRNNKLVPIPSDSFGQQTVTEELKTSEDHAILNDFIKWTARRLHLKAPFPRMIFSDDTEKAQKGHHTGVHTLEDNTIWIYTGKRNMVDIMRTVFHELVHERQGQLGMIKPGDSYPGSPIEVMADMLAGKYIKIYGKQHPQIFQ